jgi:hypothetical protein
MARRRVPHSLPSEASPAGEFARGQALLVGPAVQAPAGSVAEADYLARGDFLAALAAAVATTQAQAFLTTATSLLAEWELAYGLPVDGSLTIAQRQARLVAKVRTLRGGSPQALANMARAYDATALVYENTPATVPQAPDPFATDGATAGLQRGVFRFGLRVAPATFADAVTLATLYAFVDQMKPAHAIYTIHTNDPAVGFLTDDPNSLTDRDVVGS